MLETKIMRSLALEDVLPSKTFCKMLSSVWPKGAEMKKPTTSERQWRTSFARLRDQSERTVGSELNSLGVLLQKVDGGDTCTVLGRERSRSGLGDVSSQNLRQEAVRGQS